MLIPSKVNKIPTIICQLSLSLYIQGANIDTIIKGKLCEISTTCVIDCGEALRAT